MTTITLPLNYDQVEAKSYLSHCPISILLYRSSCCRFSGDRGARASLRYLCARRRLQTIEWRLVRALPQMPRRTFWRNEPNAVRRRASARALRASPPLRGSAPPIAVDNVQKHRYAPLPERPRSGGSKLLQKGQTCRTDCALPKPEYRVLSKATLAALVEIDSSN